MHRNLKGKWGNSVFRPFIVIVTGLVFLVPILWLMPNRFASVGKILPVESKSLGGLGGVMESAGMLGLRISGQEGTDSSALDVLNSRWLGEKLLTTNFTYKLKRFGHSGFIEKRGTLFDYLRAKNIDSALLGLNSVLTTSRDQKTRLLSIIAETKSPELSQQVANRAIELLEEFNQMKGRTRGGFKVAFADSRLADGRKDMLNAEARLLSFSQGNRNYSSSSDPAVRLLGMRLEADLRLQQQLVTSLALNREQALMEEKNDIPIFNVLDSPAIPVIPSGPKRLRICFVILFLMVFGVEVYVRRDTVLSAISRKD